MEYIKKPLVPMLPLTTFRNKPLRKNLFDETERLKPLFSITDAELYHLIGWHIEQEVKFEATGDYVNSGLHQIRKQEIVEYLARKGK